MLLAVFTLICFSQCKDEVEGADQRYGYVQFKLVKLNTTRATDELNSLADAKKIKVSMIDENNMEIQQTLNVDYFNEENAEFGVRTETLKLSSGAYKIKGYAIFDSKNNEIMSGDLIETVEFTVVSGHNSVVDLSLNVKLRGKLFFVLGKNDSDIRPKNTRAVTNSDDFEYSDIRSINVYMNRVGTTGSTKYTFKIVNAKKTSDRELFRTDTLSLSAGEYIITSYNATTADDGLGSAILAESSAGPTGLKSISISDTAMEKDTLVMTLPETAAIKDYLALYSIWTKMGGEKWDYQEAPNGATGANWVFDGRTVDTWGNQLGVGLDMDGRVRSLNIGVFNAQGEVPDEIGNLDKLEILYLGTHSEEGYLDPFQLELQGIGYKKNRIAFGKERSTYRHNKEKALFLAQKGAIPSKLSIGSEQPLYKYISTYDAAQGARANSITAISEKIGNLVNLEQLYIASGLITKLPAALSQLVKLSDLEIYNCPITEFPEQIKDLPLASLLFAKNAKVRAELVEKGLEVISSGKMNETLQLLYVNDQDITRLPGSMKNLQKLVLLDVSSNKLATLPSLKGSGTQKGVSLIQAVLDNNKLTDIPDDFCGINDLEKFSACINQIEYFPNLFTAITYYKVDEIDLSMNQIRGFKPGFSGFRVEILNLSINRFDLSPTGNRVIMPTEFGAMYDGYIGKDDKDGKHPCEVNSLKLDQCGIDSIDPGSIKNLESLEALSMVGNRLRYLPSNFGAANLPYLNGIDFSFNNFTAIPVRALNIPGLVQLVFEHQYDNNGKRVLKQFPDNLYLHPALKTLYVNGNDIISVITFPSNLNLLSIADNPNLEMTIPADMCARIANGSFSFGYDITQSGISGCSILGIE